MLSAIRWRVTGCVTAASAREDAVTIQSIARAVAIGSAFAFLSGPTLAAPQPSPVTPELIEAAKKEGKKYSQNFGI
jgi:hypothetical protein